MPLPLCCPSQRSKLDSLLLKPGGSLLVLFTKLRNLVGSVGPRGPPVKVELLEGPLLEPPLVSPLCNVPLLVLCPTGPLDPLFPPPFPPFPFPFPFLFTVGLLKLGTLVLVPPSTCPTTPVVRLKCRNSVPIREMAMLELQVTWV